MIALNEKFDEKAGKAVTQSCNSPACFLISEYSER